MGVIFPELLTESWVSLQVPVTGGDALTLRSTTTVEPAVHSTPLSPKVLAEATNKTTWILHIHEKKLWNMHKIIERELLVTNFKL